MKQTFGERFKDRRKEKGWSQERAAEIFGVQSKTTVQNWENGQDFPECARLLLIADIFDVSLDWMFGRRVKSYRPEKTPTEPSKEPLHLEPHPSVRKKAG